MPLSGRTRVAISLVSGVRKALFNNEEVINRFYKDNELEDLFIYNDKSMNLYEWFNKSKEFGLKDIKLLIPNKNNDYEVKAFINMKGIFVITYLKDKCELIRVDEKAIGSKWQYIFTIIKETEPSKIKLDNRIEEFKKTLIEIGDFAVLIECGYWKDTFMEAYNILDNKINVNLDKYKYINEKFNYLPDFNRRVLIASNVADVFGGMGSWNDTPAYMAGESLETFMEYQRLSSKLSELIDYHYMFAANECFK